MTEKNTDKKKDEKSNDLDKQIDRLQIQCRLIDIKDLRHRFIILYVKISIL